MPDTPFKHLATQAFDEVWEDRAIRFDAPVRQLEARPGERVADSVNSVEDSKGGNGERGALIVSTLRLSWVSHKNSRKNLSIGWATVAHLQIKKTKSKLRGNTKALHVATRFEGSRFEFVFTSLVQHAPKLFATALQVHKAYESTKLYRDLKLRGSVVREGKLNLLPHEEVFSQRKGVWNLSAEQGNLGSFFVTNVRLVWHAQNAENFNVSIPYMQMAEVRVRGSKFGPALVVQTTKSSGDYALGFRVDPEDRSGPARELLGAGRPAHRVTRAQAGRGDAGDHVAPPDLRAGARLRRGRVREEGGARGGRRGARTRAEISRRGPRRFGFERRAGENASRTTSRSWAAAARTTTPSWPPTTRTPGASPKKTSCTTPIWAWRSRSSRPGSPRSRCGSSRFMIKFSVVFDSAPGVARAPPSAP